MKQGHGAACHIHLNTIVIKAWILLSNVQWIIPISKVYHFQHIFKWSQFYVILFKS